MGAVKSKAIMVAFILVLLILLIGVTGGDTQVGHFGVKLHDAVDWLGRWLGKLGHWISETWKSFNGPHPAR